jgi:hypothetical protein
VEEESIAANGGRRVADDCLKPSYGHDGTVHFDDPLPLRHSPDGTGG